jgi:hypothetical protein
MADDTDWRALMVRYLAAELLDRGFILTPMYPTPEQAAAYDSLMPDIGTEFDRMVKAKLAEQN